MPELLVDERVEELTAAQQILGVELARNVGIAEHIVLVLDHPPLRSSSRREPMRARPSPPRRSPDAEPEDVAVHPVAVSQASAGSWTSLAWKLYTRSENSESA